MIVFSYSLTRKPFNVINVFTQCFLKFARVKQKSIKHVWRPKTSAYVLKMGRKPLVDKDCFKTQ